MMGVRLGAKSNVCRAGAPWALALRPREHHARGKINGGLPP